MNIAVFSHAGGSPKHGPNMRWYYLGRALNSLGVYVTIVSASWFHKYQNPPVTSSRVEEDNIDEIKYLWIKVNKYSGRVGQIINQLIYTLRSTLAVDDILSSQDIDAVVASSPHPFSIFPAYRLARKKKIPLIFEVRDLWPLVILELSGASKLNPYMLILKMTERFAVKHSNLVVSVKSGDFDYFNQEYGLTRDKFFEAPNGFFVDSPKTTNDFAQLENRSCQDNSPEKFVVGYVGAMSSYYGLNELIYAAQILTKENITFRLVGGGDDFEELCALAVKLDLANVEFVGKISKDKVLEELNRFDICYVGLKDVKANMFGISCNKLFEYMQAGKPVLASYNTLHDPVGMAACGITVEPGNADAIAKAILSMKSDPDMRERMGRLGQRYFYEHHDFKVVAKRYKNAIERLRQEMFL